MRNGQEQDQFLGEQGRILQELATALVAATPEWWDEATLRLQAHEDGYLHSIASTQHPRDIVTPTDDIYEQTFALQDLFAANSKQFTTAVFTVYRDDQNGEESWGFRVEYTY